jgi:murein DD-endopeptidase MepM/ murein hydrolase activator NlpD
MARPGSPRPTAAAVLLGGVLLACGPAGELADRLRDDRSARQRYLDGLREAGLDLNAVFLDWATAGERALSEAPLVSTPHVEEVDLPATEPAAIGLGADLRRGQLARFELERFADSTAIVFLEVWQPAGAGDTARLVAESRAAERFVAFEPPEDGRYLFRAQPELFRGGRFRLSLRVAPTLAFPVEGGKERDIGSIWGALPDGGRRSHAGIDIFARRGTPVLAAEEGWVAEVGENELGGNVVWIRDRRGDAHYYAHLDVQLVREGTRVGRGDTVGLVGNTGNARTTPPHLHFGVYRPREGPVDPFWFVVDRSRPGARLTADTAMVGGFAVPGAPTAIVRSRPGGTDTVVRLTSRDSVRVLAATGDWFRIRLGGGGTGFLPARSARAAPTAVPVEIRGTGVATAQ